MRLFVRRRKPGVRIFVRSTSFVPLWLGSVIPAACFGGLQQKSTRKNFFAKRRMRDESAAQVTSPPLANGGTCHAVIQHFVVELLEREIFSFLRLVIVAQFKNFEFA